VITQPMLRRHFDAGAFERGERYHRQGRVSALRSETGPDGAVRVTARVRGSQSSPYRQDIRLFLRDGIPTSISGVCECPVGLNCKHVAAAILTFGPARRPLLRLLRPRPRCLRRSVRCCSGWRKRRHSIPTTAIRTRCVRA